MAMREDRQSDHEIHRVEGHLSCAVPVRCLEDAEHFAGGAERQAWIGDRGHPEHGKRSHPIAKLGIQSQDRSYWMRPLHDTTPPRDTTSDITVRIRLHRMGHTGLN